MLLIDSAESWVNLSQILYNFRDKLGKYFVEILGNILQEVQHKEVELYCKLTNQHFII